MIHHQTWGISSIGRAPALHAGGQEFESLILHFKEFQVLDYIYKHPSVR